LKGDKNLEEKHIFFPDRIWKVDGKSGGVRLRCTSSDTDTMYGILCLSERNLERYYGNKKNENNIKVIFDLFVDTILCIPRWLL
jgi:hypothetical protein